MTRRFQIDIRLQFLNRRSLHFNSFYIMWNVIEYDYYPLMNLIAFYVILNSVQENTKIMCYLISQE